MVLSSIGALATPAVQDIMESRFSAHNNDFSDGERKFQLNKLAEKIDAAPIFGHGIGYYIPSWIRAGDAKYSYELQVPALVMQIGIVGVVLLFGFIFLPILYLIRNTKPLFLILFLGMSVTWLLSGFFNPVLFSSSGGVVYSMILLLCSLNIYKKQADKPTSDSVNNTELKK